MRAQSLSPRTIDERVRVVKAICTAVRAEADQITADQILTWLAAKPSAITRWCYFTNLRAFFSWLLLTGQRDTNPTLVIASPKRPKYQPRPVPFIHIEKVLSQPLRSRTRKMILLAAFAGLRVSEIARIRGSDYDPATGILTVLGKGGQLKAIPLHAELQAEFISMPRRGWWFPSPYRDGPIYGQSVGYTIQRAFRQQGIVIQAHQLRHSFGTSLIEKGVNLRVAQELMRHENITSTALYTQITVDQKQTAVNQLDIPQTTGTKKKNLTS